VLARPVLGNVGRHGEVAESVASAARSSRTSTTRLAYRMFMSVGYGKIKEILQRIVDAR